MSRLELVAIFALLGLVVCVSAAPQDSDTEVTGPLNPLLRPLINLVQNATRHVANAAQAVVNSVDTQVTNIRERVEKLAADIGRNTLSGTVQSVKLFRDQVDRLLKTVQNSQTSVQELLGDQQMSIPVRASLLGISGGLATIEAGVGTIHNLIDAGSNK